MLDLNLCPTNFYDHFGINLNGFISIKYFCFCWKINRIGSAFYALVFKIESFRINGQINSITDRIEIRKKSNCLFYSERFHSSFIASLTMVFIVNIECSIYANQ